MQLAETIKDKVQKSYESQAFLRYVGIKMESIEYGKIRMSCENRDELTQQQGFIHGGVLTTLADVSCGYAALTTMPEDAEVLTVEFKINIMRASTTKKIIADAQVLKPGKTLVVVESTVTDETEKNVLAKMLATMFTTKR